MKTMMTRKVSNVLPITAGVLGSLALAVSASGQFINVTIVPYFPVGQPAGSATYRVVANFGGQDIVFAWGAIAGIAALDFYTGNNVLLINDPNSPFAGLKQEDFAAFPIGADWDSWVTVGTTEFAGNDTDYQPGFIGSDGVTAAVVGNAFSEADALIFDSDPTSPILGPNVVLAQFTIPGVPGGVPGDPGHNGFHLEGVVNWNPFAGAGPFQTNTFVVDNIPAPGSLALLGLSGLFVRRRKRAA